MLVEKAMKLLKLNYNVNLDVKKNWLHKEEEDNNRPFDDVDDSE